MSWANEATEPGGLVGEAPDFAGRLAGKCGVERADVLVLGRQHRAERKLYYPAIAGRTSEIMTGPSHEKR